MDATFSVSLLYILLPISLARIRRQPAVRPGLLAGIPYGAMLELVCGHLTGLEVFRSTLFRYAGVGRRICSQIRAATVRKRYGPWPMDPSPNGAGLPAADQFSCACVKREAAAGCSARMLHIHRSACAAGLARVFHTLTVRRNRSVEKVRRSETQADEAPTQPGLRPEA